MAPLQRDQEYNTGLEEAFKTAKLTKWNAKTSAGWDSLYLCLCGAINESLSVAISLNKYDEPFSEAQDILTNNGIESSLQFDCGSIYLE